ncbi:MAG: formimidoylglutamate deiminase [Pseudomonadota bacterium]
MTTIWAEMALTPRGWERDVLVRITPEGRIADVTAGTARQGHAVGHLLPAPVNGHSHAFQRAMAGLTERRGPDSHDGFWAWRRLMYRFLDRLVPEQVQAITAFVQMEMLEAGYAASVEFHYLHHGPDGVPYDNLAEMAERVIAAARQTGIGLTLLPVLYRFGGCDGRALSPGQDRFGNDFDRFARLVEACRSAIAAGPQDWILGVAPHSLRAVGIQDLDHIPALAPEGPIHMHLAEQTREVEEVRAVLGARPVEWVLANLAIDARWNMVHCTQMRPEETKALARSGSTAVLCPITEANLGDGVFDGVRWLENGGDLSVGSDSNIRISFSEELRALEYSQRLRDRSRAVLASREFSTGRCLFETIVTGGARAAARRTGGLRRNAWADLMALDGAHPDLAGLSGDTILDGYVFAGDDRMITDVWSAGRHMVQEGRHIDRDRIRSAYQGAVRDVRDAI